jgi:hypothetical protein
MVDPISRRRLLASTSAAQLAAGVAGMVLAGIGLAAAMAALGLSRPRRKAPVREGTLHGGLPYLAVGQGPPLVVFVGLTAEHANTTGLARRLELQTLKPMARHFTVYAVNRRPGLHRGLDRPAVRHRPPAAGPPAGAGRDRLPAVAPRPGGAAPVRRADQAGPATAGLRGPRPHAGGHGGRGPPSGP